MFIKYIIVAALASTILSSCSEDTASNTTATPKVDQSGPAIEEAIKAIQVGKDYHSFANPESIKVTHLNLDLTVDFAKKVLVGTAQLDFQKVDSHATQLILDTRDLTINSVTAMGNALNFDVVSGDSFLGAALTIDVPADVDSVLISYQTSPKASGVQWLTPQQTAGKNIRFCSHKRKLFTHVVLFLCKTLLKSE
ncbi:hypothetical protein C427_3765 [Paraglaciecola psychrophila 170]|uniref:Uncharacterized protein n=1 Tax=Paraglaciecola psychrophila 170 TaxID=1129794 RepID=M4RT89_9ALTE|nr:hypothetical protein C427_3765 [Paraglaciecola psychrophila 170]